MPKRCRVAVDLLGAEAKSRDLLQGALSVIDSHPECDLMAICNTDELSDRHSGTLAVHCTDWVTENDSLRRVLREESKTSMRMGLELLAGGSVDGFVTLGNTGALMALSRRILKMQDGIDRPAIIKEFNGKHAPFWMLDVGANLIQKAESLVQFAHLGIAFAEGVGRIQRPRVALLNIGVEEQKGPEILRTAADELAHDSRVNFRGYVEPNRLFDGDADVVVSDGFAGNVALKSIEGTASMIRYRLRSEFNDGASDVSTNRRDPMARMIASLDAQTHNGASLVGLNGVVIKGHNSATPLGMAAAVNQAIREIGASVPVRMRHYLKLHRGESS